MGHMAERSIAVVRSQKRNEYLVLDTYYHGTDSGAAEELLDQFCRRQVQRSKRASTEGRRLLRHSHLV